MPSLVYPYAAAPEAANLGATTARQKGMSYAYIVNRFKYFFSGICSKIG